MTSKAGIEHWETIHAEADVRMRLPSNLLTNTANFIRLFGKHLRPEMSVLEIGCAPGKYLALLAHRFDVRVYGLDYSESGVRCAQRLFASLGVSGEVRCEDLFSNSFPAEHFDVVFSRGVIEHFDDPRSVVAEHLRLVKPSGMAIMTVPNYGGIYGSLQRICDPDNLAIHNLEIMSPGALRSLVAESSAWQPHAYAFGRMSPTVVNWGRRMPRILAVALMHGLNALGRVQPRDIRTLSPWLVLEVRRVP